MSSISICEMSSTNVCVRHGKIFFGLVARGRYVFLYVLYCKYAALWEKSALECNVSCCTLLDESELKGLSNTEINYCIVEVLWTRNQTSFIVGCIKHSSSRHWQVVLQVSTEMFKSAVFATATYCLYTRWHSKSGPLNSQDREYSSATMTLTQHVDDLLPVDVPCEQTATVSDTQSEHRLDVDRGDRRNETRHVLQCWLIVVAGATGMNDRRKGEGETRWIREDRGG